MLNRRYLYLITAAVMMLFSGIIYAWSILKTPYLLEFGWSQGGLGLNFTITMICFCLGGIIGGVLFKKLPIWLIINISGGLVCLGFWFSGSLRGDSIWELYLTYGVLCGSGIGIAYNAIISSIMGWFPDKRATISGILMMSFGSSSLLFGFVSDVLINSFGWRTVYHGLGLCILTVFAVCSCMLRVPSSGTITFSMDKSDAKELNIKPNEMIRSSTFWRFYIFTILLVSIGSCVISLAKDVSLFVGASEAIAVLLTGILSICNGLGRIISGALFDRLGSTNTIRTAVFIAISAIGLLLLAVYSHVVAILALGFILVGLSYGFMPPITSSFIGKTYGSVYFPVNFSIANTMLLFASFSATLGGWILGITGEYIVVFIVLMVFAALGTIISESLKSISNVNKPIS